MMKFYCAIILALLFICSTAEDHTKATICVTNGPGSECPLQNVTHTFERLSALNLTGFSIVHIFLTSGIHTLDDDLNFPDSVKHTEIHGAYHGQRSIVVCQAAGIRFSEDKNARVVVSHLTFTAREGTRHCHYRKFNKYNNVSAVLCFKKVSYKLQDVTVNSTAGYGVLAFQCFEQVIVDSLFTDNSKGHIRVFLNYYKGTLWPIPVSINISDTLFYSKEYDITTGFSIGLHLEISNKVYCKLQVSNCTFDGPAGSHMLVSAKSTKNLIDTCVHIENSVFTKAAGNIGVRLRSQGVNSVMNITIENSSFLSNSNGALYIRGAHRVAIRSCEVSRNDRKVNTHDPGITNVIFSKIDSLVIEKSRFEGNRGKYPTCSCLTVSMGNVILNDVSFTDNNCTGITLNASTMTILNVLNMTRNSGMLGGAIRMLSTQIIQDNLLTNIFSYITLNLSAKLNIVDNKAGLYGGGIYTEETCENRGQKRSCLFLFEDIPQEAAPIIFARNWAELGGDAIFGGCLSDCYVKNDSQHSITSSKFMSLQNQERSPSTFSEYPTKVAFCSPENYCTPNRTVSAYRGQQFSVPLIVADDYCTSTVEFMQAKIKESSAKLGDLCGGESYKRSKKDCEDYYYSVSADSTQSSVTIELFIHQERAANFIPAVLTVLLKDCPIGFRLDSAERECVCNAMLKSRGIKCQAGSLSLQVPPLTWIGEIDGRAAVNKYCQFCHTKGEVTIYYEMQNSTQLLCSHNRTGVLCGKCMAGNSLQLGRDECAKCSGSTYKGVLLVLGFMVLGIAMVLVILSFNLTVSTGLINGLIFYSNIVHLNNEIFLPIDRESNNKHLNNAVTVLSTFQAWMNLDFGIVTCFFEGYDMYISTWMQFVFPLYIWLLILIIVLASRYSSRVSKIITSNTVSVLATLLLLAYAKLLKTSIDAASFTDAWFLGDASKHRVWILDGNIPYLKGKHVPLFLMSFLTIVIYILPFTLLILLGPLLQAKSHCRLLTWINKLTPFLDAFYGPYTSRYRCWPGILLLARFTVLGTYAFYSLGDSPFKLATVSVIVAVLLVIWMLIGKTQNTSLHQNTRSNILELFFLLNLGFFTISSMYISTSYSENKMKHQQGLSVMMVGSVLAAFCGILAHQIFYIALRHTRLGSLVETKTAGAVEMSSNSTKETDHVSSNATHSLVEMTEHAMSNDELREPLLTDP